MKLTTRSEYALLAMVYLARRDPAEFVPALKISQARDIPYKYLEQILMLLKQSRYLRSRKGAEGGYQLAKPAGKITLAEVIRLLDGALAPTESVSRYFYEPTPIEGEKSLLRVFQEIRDHVARKLEGTTLEDVA